jgi:hypothetical protein
LAWRDGGTIAFREEIERILARLAHESQIVPPFTELVLLLAALRGEPRGTLRAERVDALEAYLANFDASASTAAARAALPSTVEVLKVLGGVPASFWARVDAFDLVACQVVERSGQARDPGRASQLETQLERGFADWVLEAPSAVQAAEEWSHALVLLGRGLERFEPSTLILRARTGLEALPPTLEIELHVGADARRLLAELRDEPEFAALAALAREVAALVHVPRPVADRTDLPLGGVSDVSNRGSPERLLTSELALDDLTLAVRIATNEALYTRREAPPRTRRHARCIALDVGIHSWGTPRVFAIAVALGLAMAVDRHDRALVWRTSGAGLVAVELSTRDGLVELLAALEPEPDPTTAFSRLFEIEQDGAESREVFLIVSEAVAKSAAMRRWMREAQRESVHLAAVGRGGHLVIERWSSRGVRKLHEAQYDLGELRRSFSASEGDPVDGLEFALPVFLHKRPLPLRVGSGAENSRYCEAREAASPELLELTSIGDLVVWNDPLEGGRVVDMFASRLDVRLFAADASGRAHLVYKLRGRPELWYSTVDLASGERWTHALDGGAAWTRFELVEGRLVLLRESEFSVVEVADGVLRATDPAKCGVHLNGRYFRSGAEIAALSFEGGRPGFIGVVSLSRMAQDAIAVFDWPGVDGPWVIFRGANRILSSASGDRTEVDFLRVQECVSLEVLTWNRKPRVVLNGNLEFVLGSGARLSGSLSCRSPAAYTLREARLRSLKSIGCDESGTLCVETRPGVHFAIRRSSASSRHGRICAEPVDQAPSSRFAFVERSGLPYGLRVARSAAGDLAITDKRGFLHLVSHDPTVAQLTVALVHDRPLRAWSSDGWSCGDAAYLMGGPTRSDVDALRVLEQHAAGFR